MQTARRIEEDHVVSVADGVRDGGLCHIDGIGLAHFKDRYADLRANDLKLPDGGGTVDVTRAQQWVFALLFEKPRELTGVGGFARTLKTHHHDDRGRLRGHADLLVVAAHQGSQLLVDDLDDHLRGRQAFEHIRAHGALGDALDEVLDDLIADVGLQKRQTDLAHRFLDVGLAQAAFAAQLFESGGQFFGKTFKCHSYSFILPAAERIRRAASSAPGTP